MLAAWCFAVLAALCYSFREPFGAVTFTGLAIGMFLSASERPRRC